MPSSIRTLLVVHVLSALAVGARSSAAEEPAKFVSLILQSVGAEKTSYGIRVSCEATLENATAKELTVKSNFYSVFDGLTVVVTSPEGRVLAQRPYIYHQSPATFTGRTFVLKEGVTNGSLVFPLHDFPGKVGDALKVRLIGTLPGSDYHNVLSSETLATKVSIESRLSLCPTPAVALAAKPSMDENPYESPRDLSPPTPQPDQATSTPHRLRQFGLTLGMLCSGAFFGFMRVVWRNNNASWINDPRVQIAVLAGVAIVFIGGVASLVTILVGNATSTQQRPVVGPSNNNAANFTVPYGGWIVVGIIAIVVCLLAWLFSRDPLAVPAG